MSDEIVLNYPYISKGFKILGIDILAYSTLLPLILFHSMETLVICILVFAFFIFLNIKGYDFPNAVRWFARFLGGKKIPASLRYRGDSRY